MDVKTEDFVNIAVRIRPSVNILPESKGIALLSENPPVLLVVDRQQSYTFDNIFSQNATQEEVYTKIVNPLKKQVLLGNNCTVLAYGQTGTGKTFTIGSNPDVYEDPGFIIRTLNDLFNGDDKEEQDLISISLSFLEIYNEKVYDLLGNHKVALSIKNFQIQGVTRHEVKSLADARTILRVGSNLRHMGETKQNVSSSRSHAIFTIHCTVQHENYKTETKLNFVDLAGSENVRKTGNEGAQFQEGVHINKGLFNIGRVIKALATNMSYVPYRQSVITTILRDSLDKSNYITFVACISPDIQDTNQTSQTLEFAQGAKKVKIGPEVNTIIQQFKTKNPTLFEKQPESAVKKTPFKRSFCSLQNLGSAAKITKTDSMWKSSSTLHEHENEFKQSSGLDQFPGSEVATPSILSISPIVRRCTEAVETTIINKLNCIINTQLHRPTVNQSPQISVKTLQSVVTHMVRSEIIQMTGEKLTTCSSHIDTNTIGVSRKLVFDDSTSQPDSVFKVPVARPRRTKVQEILNSPPKSIKRANPRRSARFNLKRTSILTNDNELSPPKRRQSLRLILKAAPTPMPRSKINMTSTPKIQIAEIPQPSTPNNPLKITDQSYKKHELKILKILNEGTEKDMQKLPSIGPKTALQIFQFRLLNGKFNSVKDLLKMGCWRGNGFQRFLTANFLK